MTILEYLDKHELIVTFSWIPMVGLMFVVVFMLKYALDRLLRSLNIWFRGWPPSYLNGDGEFINLHRVPLKPVDDEDHSGQA